MKIDKANNKRYNKNAVMGPPQVVQKVNPIINSVEPMNKTIGWRKLRYKNKTESLEYTEFTFSFPFREIIALLTRIWDKMESIFDWIISKFHK